MAQRWVRGPRFRIQSFCDLGKYVGLCVLLPLHYSLRSRKQDWDLPLQFSQARAEHPKGLLEVEDLHVMEVNWLAAALQQLGGG